MFGIYENESDILWEDRNKGRLIIEEMIELNEPVAKGTPVYVFIEVDKSGIISLRAECKGKSIKMDIETK